MSDYSLSQTLRTLASKLDGVQHMLNGQMEPPAHAHMSIPMWHTKYEPLNTTAVPQCNTTAILQKLDTLSGQVEELLRNMVVLRNQPQLQPQQQQHYSNAVSILPVHPMHGIEVVPKREVVIGDANPLSVADRLLLNKDAKKALEAEEMGASRDDEYPLGEEEEEAEEEEEEEDGSFELNGVPMINQLQTSMDVDEEEEEEEKEEEEEEEEEKAEEEEEEAEEEEEEEEEEGDGPQDDAEELQEFEYKGNTFYRDSENNVFMTDEDGDLVEEPIGSWNKEKNRIVMKKV